MLKLIHHIFLVCLNKKQGRYIYGGFKFKDNDFKIFSTFFCFFSGCILASQ